MGGEKGILLAQLSRADLTVFFFPNFQLLFSVLPPPAEGGCLEVLRTHTRRTRCQPCPLARGDTGALVTAGHDQTHAIRARAGFLPHSSTAGGGHAREHPLGCSSPWDALAASTSPLVLFPCRSTWLHVLK